MSIYGKYADYLPQILDSVLQQIQGIGQEYSANTGKSYMGTWKVASKAKKA